MASIKGLEWTFNTVAEQYDRWSPEYVPQLYADMFAYKPIGPGSTAVEVGIGTGQATGPVLDTGCSVIAVELGDRLAELARRRHAGRGDLTVVNMPFQDYSCPDGSVDLVYSARAFHWIPEELGYSKVFAILCPGGAFARFANHPHPTAGEEAMQEDIQRVYRRYMSYSAPSPEYTLDAAQRRADVALKYGFTDAQCHIYRRQRRFTAEEYVQLIATYSDHIVLPEADRAPFYEGIREAIERHGGAITLTDTIDIELARKPE